jgi:tetratricopeptide (TPR) repeat protein
MNDLQKHLIELEQRGLDLQNSGNHREAAGAFEALVNEQPDWEHGGGWYSLAGCYEDLGEWDKAERCYRTALSYGPKNDYFIGGLASFLYLHGDPDEAFRVHAVLLDLEQARGDDGGARQTMIAIKALGEKMGLNREQILRKLHELVPRVPLEAFWPS